MSTYRFQAPDQQAVRCSYGPLARHAVGEVGYFDDLAAAIQDGVDEAGLIAIAKRYAMEVVGPVREG